MKVFDKRNQLNIDFENDNAPDIKLWKNVYGSHVQIGDKIYGDSVEIEKVSDYLYMMTCKDYDYSTAKEYLMDYKYVSGACSSVRQNEWYGRNYDWLYDNTAEIITYVPAKEGRHASVGVSASKNITNEIAENKEYVESYYILPFLTLDGINDAGVCANINVVPMGDKGNTTGTNKNGNDLCVISAVRFILDFANSARDGVKKLCQQNIWSLPSLGFEIHIMVADATSSYVVEFINNKPHVMSDQDDEYDDLPNNQVIMTNFHLTDWNGEVKAVFLGDSAEDVKLTGIEKHAEGLERYSKLLELCESGAFSSEESAMQNMQSIKFTNAYDSTQDPFWYSECTGKSERFGELTVYNQKEDFDGIVAYMKELFDNRDRNKPITWQTVHSSIYNLNEKTLSVCVQEDYSNIYKFNLEGKVE